LADGCTELRFVIAERHLVISEREFPQLDAINTWLKEFAPKEPLRELGEFCHRMFYRSCPSWLSEALGTMLLSIVDRLLHPDEDDEWLQSKVARQISTKQHLLLAAIARDDTALVQSFLTASGDLSLAFAAFQRMPYLDHPYRGVRDLLALESFCNNLPPERYLSMRPLGPSISARNRYQDMKNLEPFTYMKMVLTVGRSHTSSNWYHVPAMNVSFTDLLLHRTELTYIGTCCHGMSSTTLYANTKVSRLSLNGIFQ
jgi:hypothetical protein